MIPLSSRDCCRSDIARLTLTNSLFTFNMTYYMITRRWGNSNKWSIAPTKSVAGTVAFICCACVASIAMLQWLVTLRCLQFNMSIQHMASLLLLSVICGLAELLPVPGVDDNIIVPCISAITSWRLFA